MIIQPLSETRGGCRSVLALAADDTAKIDALKDHGELGRVDLCAGLSRWHERELRQEPGEASASGEEDEVSAEDVESELLLTDCGQAVVGLSYVDRAERNESSEMSWRGRHRAIRPNNLHRACSWKASSHPIASVSLITFAS